MLGRKLVLGDIHGNLRAFEQCMERCGFNYEQDTLIQLGDVSDRYPDTALVVDHLLHIKKLVAIRGNHDEWTNQWMMTGVPDPSWLVNGGQATVDSYKKEEGKIDLKEHARFFSQFQTNYHIDDQNRIYVHGGFTHPKGPGHDASKNQCLWDRSLWFDSLSARDSGKAPEVTSGFNEIYLGHTPTTNWHQDQPMHAFNVCNLDTGAGHPVGRLTVMDVETKQYWQSDVSNQLYPD